MKNLYQMRNAFSLREYNTAITRADFEAHFNQDPRERPVHLQRLGRQELRRREPQREGLPHRPRRLRRCPVR